MNIHHLELYYYVARHGGVSAAARKIPYGLQQPAISAQVIQLENDLGRTLFTRRPFKLTAAGEELYRFIQPFFEGLEPLGRRLRGSAQASLRIGAVETVLREYLPRLLRGLRLRYPELSFTLVPAAVDEIEARVLADELDIGVGPLLGSRPAGIRRETMARVPMVLLVPSKCRYRAASQIFAEDRIAEPLIGTSNSQVSRLFQAELQRRKLEWFTSVELDSQDLITRYVVEGFGIGLVLAEPGVVLPKGVRALSLPGFPEIPYGVVWTRAGNPLLRAFIEEAQSVAQSLPGLL